MTIIDTDQSIASSSHSRASRNDLISSSSSQSPTEDLLPPSYSIVEPFNTEAVSELNPLDSKKLAREVRDSNYGIEDFGFEANTQPPSFGEGESRPIYNISSTGNITSHDESLNSSPTALARFLRLQLSSPPALSVHLRGSHNEVRTTTHYELVDGVRRAKTKHQDVEVEDFEFTIDARSEVENGLGKARGGGMRGLLYAAGEYESCHRGGIWKTVGRSFRSSGGVEGEIRLPTEDEEGARGSDKWKITGFRQNLRLGKDKKARDAKGLPAFIHPDSLSEINGNLPEETEHPPLLHQSHFLDLVETHSSVPFSLTGVVPPDYPSLVVQRELRDSAVREVVEDYCASTSTLKSLTVRKEVYGWNWEALEAGLRTTIDSARYTGKVQIKFKTTPTSLVIRPSNLSQIFSLPVWAKVFLWITLIYPVLLLIEFLSGDRYDNLRVAFPLTRWRTLPLPVTSTSSSLSRAQAIEIARPLTSRSPQVVQLPSNGTYVYLIGTLETEWLRSWENGIIDAVRRGRRGGELRETERTVNEVGF